MRKFSLIMLSLALVAFVGSTAYAGCGGCGAAAKKADCGEKCLEGLELTADQQAAVKKLMSECGKIGCDKTSKKKMTEGLKKVLSEDQMKTMMENCKKHGGGCGETAALSTLQLACGSSCGGGDKDADDKKTDA
mgnify:CR=1 FL=1